MSHPQPPQRQPTASETERYAKVVHNAALVAVIACPILAILPPRKLDLYTWGLVGATGYSANYLVRESSGRTIWQHVSRQQPQLLQPTERKEEGQQSVVGDFQKSNRSAWKIQRQQEIKEDVEEGKGFADMIMDQIWEVWNQGKTKEDDDEQ
ncbi:hypothetical protein MYCFIDRAFT_39873 [Lecanosticta acicola]|uniref:Uncharacterized protein n=1 Tax=Lecanosticta acicola TaxID=111012 RepID=A0AAI8YS35_9PEZI|nr:hypothetical protein MYCFIDRAFT_39873 [Lecanosticta acicola]